MSTGKAKCATNAGIEFDPEKLKKLLCERKKGIIEASEELGYGKSTLRMALYAGHISKPMLKGIELLYGIKYEMIAPDAEDSNEGRIVALSLDTDSIKKAITDAFLEIEAFRADQEKAGDQDAQYVMIHRAVLEAINKSFKDNIKELRGMIHAAVTSAIRMNLRKDLVNHE